MEPIQILAAIFGLFIVSRVLMKYRHNEVTLGELFFWVGLWLSIVLVALHPAITKRMADLVGVARPVDFLLYLSVLLLLYLNFRVFVRLEKMEASITKIVREIANDRKKK